jgi:hypothetical protein
MTLKPQNNRRNAKTKYLVFPSIFVDSILFKSEIRLILPRAHRAIKIPRTSPKGLNLID